MAIRYPNPILAIQSNQILEIPYWQGEGGLKFRWRMKYQESNPDICTSEIHRINIRKLKDSFSNTDARNFVCITSNTLQLLWRDHQHYSNAVFCTEMFRVSFLHPQRNNFACNDVKYDYVEFSTAIVWIKYIRPTEYPSLK